MNINKKIIAPAVFSIILLTIIIFIIARIGRQPDEAHIEKEREHHPELPAVTDDSIQLPEPDRTWQLSGSNNQYQRNRMTTSHLLGIQQILSTPRPRGRLSRIIINNTGAAPQTMLSFQTGGLGAVIDATILLAELTGQYDQVSSMVKSAEIINRASFPERPESDEFRLPVEMELSGSLKAGDFLPGVLFSNGITLKGSNHRNVTQQFVSDLSQTLHISLHSAEPQASSPFDYSLRINLSFKAGSFITLARLVYILEHHAGAFIENLTLENISAEEHQLRGALSAILAINETDIAAEDYPTSAGLTQMLAKHAERQIPHPPWDIIYPLDGPDATEMIASSRTETDPGHPDWEAAENNALVRTTRRDERDRLVLVTTIGSAAENEILSLRMGYWEYRWRVHSITLTNGELERLEAQPLPITYELPNEATPSTPRDKPPIPFQ